MAGCETRTITKPKKATSASVTAPIAAIRAGPSFVTNSKAAFTAPNPLLRGTLGKICPVHG